MSENKEYKIRAARKDEHIRMFLKSPKGSENGFKDVVLQNNALPELDFADICTKCNFLNKSINMPIMINAVTGGTEYTAAINEKLALLARDFNIPMAVGSQTIALINKEVQRSFQIVREVNQQGIVIANLSANSKVENVLEAVEMIQADAVQLHLNAAQEMVMLEGDRSFRGVLSNIKEIIQQSKVPVIVKEVGFGISYETGKRLYQAGVKYIDIGGRGGTNFVAIENSRNQERDHEFLKNWGIPTALSLLECRHVANDLKLICSGGITRSEEIVKAVCMGAGLAGISGLILRELLGNGLEAARDSIEKLDYEVRVMMLLLGARDIEKLAKTPYFLKGELHQLYKQKFTY